MSTENTPTNPITRDGSLVEIYRRVSVTDELDRITALCEPGSSVLDLGSGAGRISNPLADRGFQVTAVDDSADMLAHVRGAKTVQARIEDLRLPEKYDCVLLASSLVNYPGADGRRGLLATVAHHLKPTGKAVIQWRPPDWFAQRPVGSYQRSDGDMRQTMTILSNDGDVVLGEFTLEYGGQSLTQSFEAHRVSVDAFRTLLDEVGLTLDTENPDCSEWLAASVRR
ncbi:class I SAM-dependent methyltransferase [Mycobacterium camsae]|uniref:class I SAM-dependent methyltransferase n=1 Tax=Mycobacterium gordonae TaxID=1778 RepID=UPI0019811CA7|nr:class I SAM-dependent methyltransferase [Mycobacterium gordonae]